MTKTVLLTIGRMPKALDIARSFASNGWRVIVADPFRWHLTRMSRTVAKSVQVPAPANGKDRYLAVLKEIIDREQVDLVVPVSEETMFVADLTQTLHGPCTVYTMPADIVLRLHNKHTFITWACDIGLRVPATFAARDSGAEQLARSRDFVVKPVYSCSGRGVSFHKAGAQIPDFALASEPFVVQEKLSGSLCSTFSIADKGRSLVNVVYRAAVLSGTVAVCFERLPDAEPIVNWVTEFVRKTEYNGFISFDFILDDSGRAHAIECNPRVTSGIHFVQTDDIARAVINPEAATIRFRDHVFLQQFYPCLTETQLSLFDWPRFKSNLQCLLTSRDVSWDLHDPLPLLTMPLTASQIISRAIAKKQSFGEASTFDISWRYPYLSGASPGT